MKKLSAVFLMLTMLCSNVYAFEGEMGHFGGITAGVKLPTTASLQQLKKTTVSKYSMPYEENIYITGKAVSVKGTLEIKPGKMDLSKGVGKCTETYVYKAESLDGNSKLSRTITFNTEYVYDATLKQLTTNSVANKWTETVVVSGKTYLLDSRKSNFSKSVLQDYAPAVKYYRGDVKYEAVYKNVTDGNKEVTVSVNSPIYGFENALSKVETQKREISIGDQFYIIETPSVTGYKELQYDKNEPNAISFAGNYKELIRGEGALVYNMLQAAPELYEDEMSGSSSIAFSPTVEQLNVPSLGKIQGHPAETQIKKMYSMKVFDNNNTLISPSQTVKKKEYVAMLVKGLQIPLEEEKTSSINNNVSGVSKNPFKDVSSSDPYYKYAKAAYNVGLIGGGTFSGNKIITREELFVLNIRAIGLERLGISANKGYTPFSDDAQISSWAKSSMYAAQQLGLINTLDGKIQPKKNVTYAECATLLDQYFNYLRYDLKKDYDEKMLM